MEDFKFTKENLEKANHYFLKYPKGKEQSAIKALLDMAQRQNNGWLSKSCIEYIAVILNMPFIKVMEVASFYTMFNLKPVGKHHIKVCTTTPCCLRGADEIKDIIQNHLGVDLNEVTEDGRFSISEVECLGACVNAPVIQINDDYYEDLCPKTALHLIDQLIDSQEIKPGSARGRIGSKALDCEK